MGQKSGPVKKPAEQVVKEIRRATRRQFTAEEKMRIVLSGLRGEDSIAELCFRMNSPATSSVGNGGWPGPEVHTLTNRLSRNCQFDLARQPHQRMSKIDDVLERRSQQILLPIVSRLRHRAPPR